MHCVHVYRDLFPSRGRSEQKGFFVCLISTTALVIILLLREREQFNMDFYFFALFSPALHGDFLLGDGRPRCSDFIHVVSDLQSPMYYRRSIC